LRSCASRAVLRSLYPASVLGTASQIYYTTGDLLAGAVGTVAERAVFDEELDRVHPGRVLSVEEH